MKTAMKAVISYKYSRVLGVLLLFITIFDDLFWLKNTLDIARSIRTGLETGKLETEKLDEFS